MTMTSAEPAVAASVVLMTSDEARACVDRIKAKTEEILEEILDLRNREGWRALGYKTWQDCLREEFQMSRQRAHQLITAHMVERVLASRNFDATGMKESHLAELAPLTDDPDRMVEAAAEVRETKGSKAKAEHYRAAAGVKPARERKVIASKADAGDFADDAPEYADQSQETYQDDSSGLDCRECGGAIDLERPSSGGLCRPCQEAERAERGDPYDTADPFDGLTPHPDGVSAPVPADEGDATTDRPGAAETRDDGAIIVSQATDAEPATLPSTPAPPASSSHASQQADRPLTEPKGKSGGSHTSTVRVFSAPTLDAGDLARSLLDFPTADVLEAITENATPAQLAAIRAAIGGPVQATASTAQRVTLKDVKALIRDLTAAEIRLLESELPMLRKEIGARERAAVNGVAV